MGFILFIVIFLVIADVVAVYYLGRRRWRMELSGYRDQLWNSLTRGDSEYFHYVDIDSLPMPVQRYFRRVLRDGQMLITLAEVEHTGSFNMSATTDAWKPFHSNQKITIRRPGFLWNACVQWMPGVNVYVYDAYIGGRGFLSADLLGLFSMKKQQPSPELAHGELMRFLAEAVWYPTALLPGHGVEWLPLGEHKARALLSDGGIDISLVFNFDEMGYITSIYSEGRYCDEQGKMVLVPWEVKVWDYVELDDMKVPRYGEVAWHKQDGRKEYYHGKLKRVRYEY